MDNNLLEFYILLYATRNESFLIKIEQYLFTGEKGRVNTSKKYFTDMNYQIFFNIVCVIRNKINKLPSLSDLEFIISGKFKDDIDRKTSLLDLARDVYKSDEVVDFMLIEKDAENFIKEVKFLEAFSSSSKDIQGKDYEVAIEKLQKATQINFDTNLGVDLKNWDQIKKLVIDKNSSDSVVPTGYNFLDKDNILDGGLRGGEIGCVAAIPGIGKTLFLGNLGINAFLDEKNVLIISFETSDMRVTTRLMANLLKMTTRDITTNMVAGSDEDVKQAWEENILSQKGRIIVKEFPARTISANDIMSYLMDLKRYWDFEPDEIILDYLLIMAPNNKRGYDDANSYLKFKAVTEEVRNLAKVLDIPIWTATQIGRSGQDEKGGSKEITTSKDMSESRGIYDTVDFFSTLNQTLFQKKNLKLNMFIDKCRNGESGGKVDLKVDYKTMTIVEDV